MGASAGIKYTRRPAVRLVSVCMFPLGWLLFCFFFLDYIIIPLSGPPGWYCGKESTCHCRGCGFDPWIGKIPWRRKWQPTPDSFLEKSHGQRSLASYSPWGHKESDMTEQLNTHTHTHTHTPNTLIFLISEFKRNWSLL